MTIAAFLSFCLQLVFAVFELTGDLDTCSLDSDDCFSCSAGLHNNVRYWLLYTPEFYISVILSIALSMLVLLWCVLFHVLSFFFCKGTQTHTNIHEYTAAHTNTLAQGHDQRPFAAGNFQRIRTENLWELPSEYESSSPSLIAAHPFSSYLLRDLLFILFQIFSKAFQWQQVANLCPSCLVCTREVLSRSK